MIGLVMRREIREVWRDRRARGAVLIGPIFSVALMVILFGSIGKLFEGAAKSPIHYVAASTGGRNALLEAFSKGGFRTVAVPSVEAGDKLIRAGDAKLVLVFPESPDAALAAGRPVRLEARYDPDEQRAKILLGSVEGAVTEANRTAVRALLTAKGLDPESASPLRLKTTEVRVGKAGASQVLVSIIPYLVVLWAFYGGFGIASDIVAGEKERQTLETLLTTPVGRRDVALGKLLALTVLCAAAATAAVLTLVILAALRLPLTADVFRGGFGASPVGLLVAVAVVVPLAAMFAALLLAISTFARNTREAQTYLAQTSFVVLIPAVFSQFIGLTDAGRSGWVSFVPVLNVANVLRLMLLGRYDAGGIAITILVSGVLAAAALAIAVRLFLREEVLTRI